MERLYPIHSITEYNTDNNHATLHPLVSVIDFSKANMREWGDFKAVKFQYGLYCIYLKEVKCGDIKYGCEYYDYQSGTLVFFAPGQVSVVEKPAAPVKPKGYGLVFHPDLLIGTELGNSISKYKFFDYATNEALHLSDEERRMVLESFARIEYELKQPIDKHSKKLIASSIQLFLDYCQRFYDRQFITRDNVNAGILERFEQLLNNYYEVGLPALNGLPSVSYFADRLHLSPNYFGDLIKKGTGQTAKDYIQNKIIEVAKKVVIETDKSINEIALELGFKYPQHFTRLFKQKIGKTPNEYRTLK